MYVTAKLSGKIQAIKLTEDVIAARGEYILIDEQDHITVLSEVEFKRWFRTPMKNAQLAAKPTRAKRGTSGKVRHDIDPNGAICDPHTNSPYKRAILAFGPKAGGGFLDNLDRNKISETTGLMSGSASSAISDLTRCGYLRRLEFGSKDFRYSLTQKGVDMSAKIRRVAEMNKKNPAG